jgi:hypothetical protein
MLQNIFQPIRVIDNCVDDELLYQLQTRVKQMEKLRGLTHLFKIFRQNPEVDSITINGCNESVYDDNGYYDEFNIETFELNNAAGEEIVEFILDGTAYCFDQEPEDESTVFWNDYEMDAYLYVCKDELSTLLLDYDGDDLVLTREKVLPFLEDNFDFDDCLVSLNLN